MMCDKCGGGRKGLCPVSMGLAVGLTFGLAVLVWTAWTMWGGMTMGTMSHMMPPSDWAEAFTMAGWCLLKGFFFGFFIALFYDIISCCISKCCKKSCGTNGCGCGNPACNCQCSKK